MRKVLEVIWGVRKQKYFCKEGWTPLSTNRPSGKSPHGGEEQIAVESRMEISPSFRGALLREPESITTIGSMDSGPAHPYVDGPRAARCFLASDRIACIHMSGLLVRV